eukprot:TRINITY_DN55772_c0_g1_i1.p1 TRINITY_DN55772_c0_g1~~TRINITY_DN55772_c0_g1_i1.p1  ORF type:complete len:496 (-),score=73.91 TRINITY_DN55772_c0_g1_i1:51-1499(-)
MAALPWCVEVVAAADCRAMRRWRHQTVAACSNAVSAGWCPASALVRGGCHGELGGTTAIRSGAFERHRQRRIASGRRAVASSPYFPRALTTPPRGGGVSTCIWAAAGGHGPPPELEKALRPGNIPHGTPYSKELRLFSHILNTARRGDPESVCEAVENFGERVLSPSGQWLKVAAGGKADILTDSVQRAPRRGSILEIGTYCGYSAIRMALARPDTRVVSMEVDPAHMVIARNVVAFAGLAHRIDVWTGHSKDIMHRLPNKYGGVERFRICAVFMDQKGSRYEEDLSTLESLGILLPGAVVIADNVLKPGSPLFLWRLTRGSYETEIISVKEFAMPSEDWMSVSVLRADAPAAKAAAAARKAWAEAAASGQLDAPRPVVLPKPPITPDEPATDAESELAQLQWEADRMRAQATRKGQSVTYAEWSAFAEHMKERLATFGIRATSDSSQMKPKYRKLTSAASGQAEETPPRRPTSWVGTTPGC